MRRRAAHRLAAQTTPAQNCCVGVAQRQSAARSHQQQHGPQQRCMQHEKGKVCVCTASSGRRPPWQAGRPAGLCSAHAHAQPAGSKAGPSAHHTRHNRACSAGCSAQPHSISTYTDPLAHMHMRTRARIVAAVLQLCKPHTRARTHLRRITHTQRPACTGSAATPLVDNRRTRWNLARSAWQHQMLRRAHDTHAGGPHTLPLLSARFIEVGSSHRQPSSPSFARHATSAWEKNPSAARAPTEQPAVGQPHAPARQHLPPPVLCRHTPQPAWPRPHRQEAPQKKLGGMETTSSAPAATLGCTHPERLASLHVAMPKRRNAPAPFRPLPATSASAGNTAPSPRAAVHHRSQLYTPGAP